MLYFAYGSNMSSLRLQARTPSAEVVGAAQLAKHQLRFHKRSHDGSGKCDAYETGRAHDCVHGVVFRIARDEIPALDKAEGLGVGYEKKQVQLFNAGSPALVAFTYYAIDVRKGLSPYCWYKEHVLRGAEEHGLPQDYISRLRAIGHVDDDDPARIARETQIYRRR